MPTYNKKELENLAEKYGFIRDTFEKTFRLVKILEFINSNEFLSERLLLKGGTAINLTILDLPRLSVDIDLDYRFNESKEQIAENRRKITDLISTYMEKNGYKMSNKARYSYALDSLRFDYLNSGGNIDTIKIDINYLTRTHILNPTLANIIPPIFNCECKIWTVNPIEIFASKIVALLTRGLPRDLYDLIDIKNAQLFENDKDLLRKCVVFYISMTSDEGDIDGFSSINDLNLMKTRRELNSVVTKHTRLRLNEWKEEAIKYLEELLVFTDNEVEYLKRFNNKDYCPELLFDDAEIIERLKNHPMALWKCQ